MKSVLAGLALVSAVAVATPAFATDVINQDNKGYKLTIVDGSVTSTKAVGSRTSAYGLCGSGPCTFKIGGESITVGKNDTIYITGGKFRKP